MRILFWICRVGLSIGLIVSCANLAYNIDGYNDDVYLADSAPQATQLSGEYILNALNDLAYVLADAVFFIVFELIVISYYIKRRTVNPKEKNETILSNSN